METVAVRIQCISKVRPLFLQLEPMKALAGQLKKDKDVASIKVNSLQQEMDEIVTRIQVLFSHKYECYYFIFMRDMSDNIVSSWRYDCCIFYGRYECYYCNLYERYECYVSAM